MLYQELPRIDATPLDGWSRWLAPALVLGAALSAALLLVLLGQMVPAAAVAVGGGIAGLFVYGRGSSPARPSVPLVSGPDYSVVGSALGFLGDPAALTTSEGALLIANEAYRERFGTSAPAELGSDEDARHVLEMAKSMA